MAKRRVPAHHQEVAGRLRLTREALELSQTDMAAKVGISPQAWNNYEQAARLISREMAIQVCEAIGVSLDWIYRGERAMLPMKLEAGIRKLEEAASRPAKRA